MSANLLQPMAHLGLDLLSQKGMEANELKFFQEMKLLQSSDCLAPSLANLSAASLPMNPE